MTLMLSVEPANPRKSAGLPAGLQLAENRQPGTRVT
eukprot:COSAG02_NODE_67498_length_253_cov_0.337662_1_plen_35_part_01